MLEIAISFFFLFVFKLVTYSYSFSTSVWIKILQVKLEQGIEMLNILKNYETEMSILDDFDFYEERQKAMQERKVKQQAGPVGVGVVGDSEHRNAVTISGDFIKQMSKSFAQVVRMDEGSKEASLTERATSASDASVGARVKLEDSLSAAVSSAHTI